MKLKKRPTFLVTHLVNEPISEKLFNDLMKKSTEFDEWFEGFEKETLPQAITRLKDDLAMFFRDFNLPSILHKDISKLVDDWFKREILGDE